ncbi:hypothetical protein Q3G72_024781 [Acer saccharum]|nr:hypothetical protein Q3G72_024781 [Acer saccharum]
MSEILSNTRLDREQRSLLDVMISSGDLVLQLINDILDLSKVESGIKLYVIPEPPFAQEELHQKSKANQSTTNAAIEENHHQSTTSHGTNHVSANSMCKCCNGKGVDKDQDQIQNEENSNQLSAAKPPRNISTMMRHCSSSAWLSESVRIFMYHFFSCQLGIKMCLMILL